MTAIHSFCISHPHMPPMSTKPLCTRLARYFMCGRAKYSAKTDDTKTQKGLCPGDIVHPHAIANVFEPRIDVLEKMVSELKTITKNTAGVQQTQTTRILELLESLHVEHISLASADSPLPNRNCNQHTYAKRPSLVIPPPPPLKPHSSHDEIHTKSNSDQQTDPQSPVWFPVSVESTVYHDARQQI